MNNLVGILFMLVVALIIGFIIGSADFLKNATELTENQYDC